VFLNAMKSVLTSSRRKEARGPGAEGVGVTRYLALSLGVHLAVVFLISIPLVHRVRPIFAEPIFQVALVEWPEPNYVPPAPARVLPRPQDKPQEKPPAEKKPEPDAVKIKDTRKEPEKPREEPKPVVAETKKAETRPVVPDASPVEHATPTDAPEGPVSLGAVDQTDFKHDYYLQIVMSRLAQAWVRPPGGQGVTRATIHFIIRRDGSIVQPFLQEPSGWALYDRSVDRAVHEVRQLPPLPEAYAGDQLGVTAVFQRIGDEP
jgi:protein TonB